MQPTSMLWKCPRNARWLDIRYLKERGQAQSGKYGQQAQRARLSVHHACWMIDKGMDHTLTSPQAKIVASQAAQDITSRSMEIVGSQAYVNGNPAEKYLRDAKMLSIVDGSEQFHRFLLASQL